MAKLQSTSGPWHYKANFSTGDSKEIAKSKMQFSAAWLACAFDENGQSRVWMGFARNRELAAKAIYRETAIFRTGRYNGRKVGEPKALRHTEIIDVTGETVEASRRLA